MTSSFVLDLAVHSSLVEGLVGRDDGGVAQQRGADLGHDGLQLLLPLAGCPGRQVVRYQQLLLKVSVRETASIRAPG